MSLGHRGICPPPLLLFSRLFLVHLLFLLLFPALLVARRAGRHLPLRPRLLPGGGGRSARGAARRRQPPLSRLRVFLGQRHSALQSHCTSPGAGAGPLPSPRGPRLPACSRPCSKCLEPGAATSASSSACLRAATSRSRLSPAQSARPVACPVRSRPSCWRPTGAINQLPR